MRDITLVGFIIFGALATFRYPFVGVMLWTWITLMVPHQQTYGFAQRFQVNLLVAVATLAAWMISKERKSPPVDATLVMLGLFLAWITLNGFQSAYPEWSWPLWDRTWRIMLLGVLVAIMATNRVRIHAVLLTMVLSLMYFGVKGGLFTLMTGGTNHVQGPGNSPIADNNQLALATLMVLPLANYLRMHSANLLVRRILLAALILSLFSILGSYSRGAFIALAGLVVVAWFRTRKKWLYPLVAVAVVVPAVLFMPPSFFNRMNTINDTGGDSSFQGRLDAWHVATAYATDHFPFGAGMSVIETGPIFERYAPGKPAHAAHSIYFEVLGDNGFIGLGIYLVLLATCFVNSMTIRRKAKNRPELAWAYDLAGMLQLTLFVFCLGGAALSMAYYDVFFISAGLLSVLREMVLRRVGAPGFRGKAVDFSRSALPAGGLVAEP